MELHNFHIKKSLPFKLRGKLSINWKDFESSMGHSIQNKGGENSHVFYTRGYRHAQTAQFLVLRRHL